MAAPIARGPLAFLLQNQAGQWMTISLGAIYTFPEQAKMVLGDLGNWSSLAKQLSGFNVPTLQDGSKSVQAAAAPQPIIIHHHNGANDKNQYVSLLIKVAIGGTACWLGYFALTNALPEWVQEYFPVTRKFFAKTSKFLVASIEQVRYVLEKQIGIVSKKQDDLSDKLDVTHDSVLGLHKELGDARTDLNNLNESMARQESTLNASSRTQSYTSKGVTLLVRCVASMLPSNDHTVHDLAEYIKDGEEISKHEQKQEQQRRLSGVAFRTTPVSMISPDPSSKKKKIDQQKQQPLMLVRESRADSDMDSLEDVHSVLGIKPGQGFLQSV
jgi:hypothetical protein